MPVELSLTDSRERLLILVFENLNLPSRSIVAVGGSRLITGASGIGFVRHKNSSQPAVAFRGSAREGESEMNEPGGNAGDRIRMYQPRVGL